VASNAVSFCTSSTTAAWTGRRRSNAWAWPLRQFASSLVAKLAVHTSTFGYRASTANGAKLEAVS
jgi:hypothetical protein